MNFKQGYHKQGLWTWNEEIFLSKLTEGAEDECWINHTFPQSPGGPLFGARLIDEESGRTRRQMTQARRVQAMRYFGDIVGQQIRHTCNNSQCMNPKHFRFEPTRVKRKQG